MNNAIRSGFDHVVDNVTETFAEVKPKLRGWLHLGTVPLTVAAGVVLIALSPTATTRIGSSVFVASALTYRYVEKPWRDRGKVVSDRIEAGGGSQRRGGALSS